MVFDFQDKGTWVVQNNNSSNKSNQHESHCESLTSS